MNIQAAIIDFDGTIVTEDISDLLCDLVGKKAESEKLNRLFHEGKLQGLAGLIQRINFLTGLSLEEIQGVVNKNNYLRDGAKELFSFFRSNNIVSIIASGSIIPLLENYQKLLGADYIVGSSPIITDGRIISISEKEYSGMDFKVRDSKEILEKLNIPHSDVIAIGDSPADKGIFELAAVSIAIDPKAGIEKFTDYVIENNLNEAKVILEDLMNGAAI
jgi:phosphoserine phosphatase